MNRIIRVKQSSDNSFFLCLKWKGFKEAWKQAGFIPGVSLAYHFVKDKGYSEEDAWDAAFAVRGVLNKFMLENRYITAKRIRETYEDYQK